VGAEVRNLYVVLSAKTTDFTGRMVASGAAARKFGDDVTSMSDKQQRALHSLGSSFGKVGLSAAVGLALMAKAAVDWESEFAGVRKTVNGTAEEISGLEDNLRGMARTMPASHKEIAATAEAAGQLGVATENVADFTKVMVEMGETTNLTSDDAATSIAQFMNVMQTLPENVDRIGNTIVDLGNKGASTEADILSMAQRLSGVGKLIGAPESDVLGLSSAMANLGIQSELGGGAMSRVISIMHTAVLDGGDDLRGFAEVAGLSADEFAAKWRSAPADAIDDFLQGLGRVDASGGNAIATMADLGIKGTQNRDVMLRLAGSGDMLSTSLDQSAQAWEQNSALSTEYGKRAETTGAQAEVALNNIRDAGIEMGDSLLPIVAAVAQGMSAVAQTTGKVPEPMQDATVTALGLVAVIGGAAWFGSKVVRGVSDTRAALGDLGWTAERTQGSLGRVARMGARLTVVATAVTLLGEAVDKASGSKMDMTDLQRNLEAVSNGQGEDTLKKITSDLQTLGDTSAKYAEPVKELITSLTFNQWDTPLDNATDNIEAVDQQLAALVESGNAEEAADLFDIIMSAFTGMSAATTQFSPSWSQFDSYATAVQNASSAAAKGADANTGYAGGVQDAGAAAADAAEDVKKLVSQMLKQRDAALGAFDAQTAWGQAIADARAQAKTGEKGLNQYTEAGRNNRSALSSLAEAWNNQSPKVRNSREEYAKARRTFIEVAESMGVAAPRARELADELIAIPKSTVAKIHVDDGQAVSAMDRVREMLDRLDGKRAQTVVETVYQATNKPKRHPDGDDNADGGLYSAGRKFADGGFGDGGRYYERSPKIVAGGANVLWGEKETGWEAYISGKPSQLGRNRQIWAEAGHRLGIDPGPRGRAPAGGGAVVNNHITQFSGRMTLEVGGHRFTAYVREVAEGTVRDLGEVSERSARSHDAMRWGT